MKTSEQLGTVTLLLIFRIDSNRRGSPRGLGKQGNKGKILLETREHDSCFREHGNIN